MKFSPIAISAGIALLSVLMGVAFYGGMFKAVQSEDPSLRFFLGVGVSALIIGLGGAAGRIPKAIKVLSSAESEKKELRNSFQEILVYSTSFVVGAILLILLAAIFGASPF